MAADQPRGLEGKPVLIVHGDRDRVASLQRAATVARRVAMQTEIDFVVVKGGKHAMLSHGDKFIKPVERLRARDPRTSFRVGAVNSGHPVRVPTKENQHGRPDSKPGEARPVPDRGLRQGEGARDLPHRSHRAGDPPGLQEEAQGPSEGDEAAREARREAPEEGRRQLADRQGRRACQSRCRRRQGTAPRGSRDGRGREAAEEREDRVLRGARGDRDVHGDRGPGRGGRGQGDRQGGEGNPPRGGAHGRVPREADPDPHPRGGQGGDPEGRARRRFDPQEHHSQAEHGVIVERQPREQAGRERKPAASRKPAAKKRSGGGTKKKS